MHPEQFYQVNPQHAVPLVPLSPHELSSQSTLLSIFEKNYLKAQQFKADVGQIVVIPNENGLAAKVLIGIGDNEPLAKVLATVATRLPAGVYTFPTMLSQTELLAWSLAQYRFDQYKACTTSPRVLVVPEAHLAMLLDEAAAIFLVRDLINLPPNDLDPSYLADLLAKMAHQFNAEFNQWVGDELLKANFPAIHAVGRAAASPPRLLSLTWGEKNAPLISLVGKGVCFDSGGLDIKPPSAMRLMKKDMGGAAQVIGLAQWIMSQKLPIRLQVLIPAVENSISANAYRPGDILTMRNGKRVEIHDTDAEGRLVLADAITKACEEKPALLINFATLTGAARVAVGTEIAALFSNHNESAEAILKSSQVTQDPVWRLPLFESYETLYASEIADFSNASASPYAGAITAALFLQRFVTPGLPWLHFDVMAWNVSSKPGKPEGGEAMGLRAVAHYLTERYT